jgi:hypothetical protein
MIKVFVNNLVKGFLPKCAQRKLVQRCNLEVAQFGPDIWSGIPLLEWFDTFEREMAIFGNKGGMRLPHQFAVYTINHFTHT